MTTTEVETPPPVLSVQMSTCVQGYIDARKRAGESWLSMGMWLTKARAEAKYGEWSIFLEATQTNEDQAKRLIAVYAQSQADRRFADAMRTNFLSVATGYELISAPADVQDRLLSGDTPPTVKHIRGEKRQAANPAPAPTLDTPPTVEQIAPPAESDLPPDFAIVKRRLAAHGIALLSNMQGHHRAFVTRREGMTGIVTFAWADVLSKLERLEAEPLPKESDVAFRRTCPTCGEPILNGIWGDLKECGSCYHARQRTPTAPPAPAVPAGWICEQCGVIVTDMKRPMNPICSTCIIQRQADRARADRLPAVPPRPRRPVSADVSAQTAYTSALEIYASALEAFIMELQRRTQ